MPRPALAAALTVLLLATGCTAGGGDGADDGRDETEVAATPPADLEPPAVGACRVLAPADVAEAVDDTEPVSCASAHTAETFLVGRFSRRLAALEPDDPALGAEVFTGCSRGYRRFTGANESLALRSVLDWAWFRPSDEAWAAGARWYRCDVVGGDETSTELLGLPQTARGILLGEPADRWMACVSGARVAGSARVPCSERHRWRAVATVVVGEDRERWPGSRAVEVRSRDFCSDWVGAWLSYPVEYEYAYTWFSKAEWDAGNRRSVCWSRQG